MAPNLYFVLQILQPWLRNRILFIGIQQPWLQNRILFIGIHQHLPGVSNAAASPMLVQRQIQGRAPTAVLEDRVSTCLEEAAHAERLGSCGCNLQRRGSSTGSELAQQRKHRPSTKNPTEGWRDHSGQGGLQG